MPRERLIGESHDAKGIAHRYVINQDRIEMPRGLAEVSALFFS